MSNILRAFINIVNHHKEDISIVNDGNDRATNMGEGLEKYIQNIFASTHNLSSEKERLQKFSKVYSYQGNKNNPPDLMLKNSDAIEIKKIESKNSAIALNSSYPKDKLYSNSKMITKSCRECEVWQEKDMLYVIGYVKQKKLKSLWLIYGDCFCANSDTYNKMKDTISEEINRIEGIEFAKTNELGKVKKIDPLGITDLRIRGMWHIENPNKIFSYIQEYDESIEFQITAIILDDKYHTLPQIDKTTIENMDSGTIKEIKIKDPNNPVKLLNAKLLTFKVTS